MYLRIVEFLERLLVDGILTSEQEIFLKEKFNQDISGLFEHLIRQGMVSPSLLATKWADFINIPRVDLAKTLFQSGVVGQLSKTFCQQNACIPLYKIGEFVTVAMFNPVDIEKITEIEKLIDAHVSPVFSLAAEIRDAISIQFNSLESVVELVKQIDLSEFKVSPQANVVELEKITQKESIIALTQTILLWGVKEGASDIHIEPSELKVCIRFRIDGVMQRKMDIQLSLLNPLISRLKVLANANLVEKRRPQDGRINLQLESGVFDFRFSVVPGIYGEKAVLRILGHVNKYDVPSITDLDLSRRHYNILKEVLNSPNGRCDANRSE